MSVAIAPSAVALRQAQGPSGSLVTPLSIDSALLDTEPVEESASLSTTVTEPVEGPASLPVTVTEPVEVASSPQLHSTNKARSKTKAQRYVESISRSESLKSSVLGVLALTEGGDTLASWNSGQRMVPASTMKLITTGLAIHRLGPDFKYVTRIGYSGSIKDGILDGDLYIVGGGDPTIASKDSIAIPRAKLFAQWKSFLDKAGIKKINGKVIGDGRYFDGPIEHDTWSYQDIGTAYGAGGNGLCFYENAQDFRVSAGPSVGSPVNVTVSFPNTPWMRYEYPCRTAPAGTGDQLYLSTPNSFLTPRSAARSPSTTSPKPRSSATSSEPTPAPIISVNI